MAMAMRSTSVPSSLLLIGLGAIVCPVGSVPVCSSKPDPARGERYVAWGWHGKEGRGGGAGLHCASWKIGPQHDRQESANLQSAGWVSKHMLCSVN